jgi:putative flippase GtrA
MKHKKTAVDFIKFLSVGGVWTLINIVLMWLLIDLLGMAGWLGSTIVVIIAFLGRYYTYLSINLIHNHFIKYASTNITFSVTTILLMSLAVDVLKFPAIISAPVIIMGLFILKFLVFNKINLIKK